MGDCREPEFCDKNINCSRRDSIVVLTPSNQETTVFKEVQNTQQIN